MAEASSIESVEGLPFAPDGSEELNGFAIGYRVRHAKVEGLGHVQGFPKVLPREHPERAMVEVHWDDHTTSWARTDLLERLDVNLLYEAAEAIGELQPPFNPSHPPASERLRRRLLAAAGASATGEPGKP